MTRGQSLYSEHIPTIIGMPQLGGRKLLAFKPIDLRLEIPKGGKSPGAGSPKVEVQTIRTFELTFTGQDPERQPPFTFPVKVHWSLDPSKYHHVYNTGPWYSSFAIENFIVVAPGDPRYPRRRVDAYSTGGPAKKKAGTRRGKGGNGGNASKGNRTNKTQASK